jgi:hypothetical protein
MHNRTVPAETGRILCRLRGLWIRGRLPLGQWSEAEEPLTLLTTSDGPFG